MRLIILKPTREQAAWLSKWVPEPPLRQLRLYFGTTFQPRWCRNRAALYPAGLPDPPLLVSFPKGTSPKSMSPRICYLQRGPRRWTLYFPNPPKPQPSGRAPMPSLARHAATQLPPWPRARP